MTAYRDRHLAGDYEAKKPQAKKATASKSTSKKAAKK